MIRFFDANAFATLFLQDTYWIDLRAPIEFAGGTIPDAVNLPLLTDHERHEIGTVYKTSGQAAAIARGHQIVSGSVREERLQTWLHQIQAHPNTAVLFCFRGGLRSQIVQKWLFERGVLSPIVAGGYKALRRFLIESLERIIPKVKILVVSGPTGSGKTQFLRQSGRPFVDLEALARHRGSAFGACDGEQPSQVDFENALAKTFLHLDPVEDEILIESESRLIGKCCLPAILLQKIRSSPRLVLDVPFEDRVENIFNDYILKSKLGTHNDVTRFDELRSSVKAIARKLGGTRTQDILNDLAHAESQFRQKACLNDNRIWIRKLLLWYYDPRYQHSRKA